MRQSRDVKIGSNKNLLPEVAGITGEELYTTVIKIFDSFGSQNYILGMDYTKAFDVLDPQVTKALLKKHGWPDDLIRLLVLVWSNNRRFICWGHHVHPFPLQGPSMPQGDPWGPLICSLWVQAGITSLNPPGFFISTYPRMTDVLLLTLLSNYTNSLIVGLIRPVGLACWKRLLSLQSCLPQQSVKDWVRVLGACSATTARVLCPVEGNRLSGALRTADLLGSHGWLLSKAGLLSVLGFGPMLLPGFLLTSCPVVLPLCLVGSVLLNTIFALVGELGVGASGPILAVNELRPSIFRLSLFGPCPANSVALGATVSPASFRVRPS